MTAGFPRKLRRTVNDSAGTEAEIHVRFINRVSAEDSDTPDEVARRQREQKFVSERVSERDNGVDAATHTPPGVNLERVEQ